MIKRVIKYFRDLNTEFRFQLLVLILLMGLVMTFLTLSEDIILGFDKSTIWVGVFLFVTIILGLIMFYFLHKPEWAVLEIGLLLFGIGLPATFLTSGGLQGGTQVWYVIGLFYFFIMYNGKKLAILVTIILSIDIATYLLAYYHPEYIKELPDRDSMFIDSALAVIIVGVGIGVLLKYQLYQVEKEANLIKKQKEELEKMEQSRNQVFTNMSHKIRTPIHTIVGLNELILREELSPTARENSMLIEYSGKTLLSLTNDIFDIAQMETGKMELCPNEYSTRILFEELSDMLRPKLKEKNLDFVLDIDGNLPCRLYGDEKRLRQVLLNLLLNAVQYTSHGKVGLSVTGELVGEEWVRMKLVVSDTGIGIHKEELDEIFVAYKKGEQQISEDGVGLGLAICKHLVTLMGGEITVASTYTKGSEFTVLLEQKVVDASPVGTIEYTITNYIADRKRYKHSFEASEAKILLVDDNEKNLLVLTKLLAPTKMEIDTAQSGKECLELTKKKHYQVILLDHKMPEMDGLETLAEIRKQKNGLCKNTPVLAMTSNTVADSDKFYLGHGFLGFLEKPIRGELLELQIMDMLPNELIEYRASNSMAYGPYGTEQVRTHSFKSQKKKKICITADCVCDMSTEFAESIGVRLMYLYITTKNARFRDTIEISSDNLGQYSKMLDDEFYSDSASVEEFETFFASALEEAEEVIHISIASGIGVSYNTACQAARGFGHVHVVNSQQISGGEALLVLKAAQMATAGMSVSEICEELIHISSKINNSYVIQKNGKMFERNYVQKVPWSIKFNDKLKDKLKICPILCTKNSRLVLSGFVLGDKELSWKHYIRRLFWRKKRVDSEIVFITHVGLSDVQLQDIKDEIARYIPFKEVCVEKASVSSACNCGLHSLCIAFFTKNKAG